MSSLTPCSSLDGSLLLLEVELMETKTGKKYRLPSEAEIASIIGSGINGNYIYRSLFSTNI